MAGAGILLAVAAGGALGALARFAVILFSLRFAGAGFPWGTLGVNLAGSLLMGLCAGWFVRHLGDPAAPRAFLMIGVLGSFTTFSTFSLDTLVLLERGETLSAVVYVLTSVVFSILACLVGLVLMRTMIGGAALS